MGATSAGRSIDRSGQWAVDGLGDRSGNWRIAVERTVTGLGYELVDLERAQRGLLRVFIDRVPGTVYESGAGEFVTVDDCEKLTRQLQYVLDVEGLDYARLEVSSPGLDRPLKTAADYRRFCGHDIDVTFKLPFQGRKKYRGLLQAGSGDTSAANDAGWRIVIGDASSHQALDFTLAEVREARLVPVLNFKGKAAKPSVDEALPQAEQDGGRSE